MPLDLAAALRRHLLQRFPADRDYPHAALHAEGMPPLIGAFLDRTLDRWVEIERAQIRSDWFDFDDAEVRETEDRFFDALARTARVPAEAWKGTLGGTVDLVVRFLTTPARALTDAIFEGSADPLPADEVRARLSMFDAYPYFAEVAGAYLERKQPLPLEPPDLFGLLDRIDRRVVSDYGPDDWVALLTPLFGLARYAPEFGGVPASLLKRFFEMKGEPDIAVRLGKHIGSALDEEALHTLLVGEQRTVNGEHRPVTGEQRTMDAEAEDAETEEAEATANVASLAAPLAPSDPPPALEEPDTAEPEEPELEEPEPPASEVETEDEPALEALELPALELPPDDGRASDEKRGTKDEERNVPAEATIEPARGEPLAETAPDEPEPAEAEGDEAVPLWQRFAQHASEDDNVNARFVNGEAHPSDEGGAPTSEYDAAPLWKRFFSRPDDKPSPLPPLPASEPAPAPRPVRPAPTRADSLEELERRVLGASTSGQRSRFVKHLFGGDAGKYATALHTLDTATSWTEASQIIARDVFRPLRINIYSEHAVAFTDAVEARFRK